MELDMKTKLQDLKLKLLSSEMLKYNLIHRRNLATRLKLLADRSTLLKLQEETKLLAEMIQTTTQDHKQKELAQKRRAERNVFLFSSSTILSIVCLLVSYPQIVLTLQDCKLCVGHKHSLILTC